MKPLHLLIPQEFNDFESSTDCWNRMAADLTKSRGFSEASGPPISRRLRRLFARLKKRPKDLGSLETSGIKKRCGGLNRRRKEMQIANSRLRLNGLSPS